MIKVLLVEDELVLREAIKEALEISGYLVRIATDGIEGYTSLDTDLPDVIISDLKMPNIDGMGLLSLVRKNKKFNKIPYIIISAKTEVNDIRKAMIAGADDYITKPFSIDNLMDSVRARINRINTIASENVTTVVNTKETVSTNSDISGLSNRERSIYQLVSQGLTSKDIALKLSISNKTVLSHKRNIMEKLGISGHGSLLSYAISHLKKA